MEDSKFIRCHIDTETTGLVPGKHFPVQVSGILEKNGEILHKFDYRMRPPKVSGFVIDPKALEKNGLTIEEIKADTAKDHSVTRKDIVRMLFEIITDVDDTFDLAKLVDADKDERSRFFRMMQQTKNSDKLRALEQLTKMLGLNEPEQSKSEQQITINIKRDRDK